jgi:hypothetical protein
VIHSFGIAAVLLAIAGGVLLCLGWRAAPERGKFETEWDKLNDLRQEYSALFGLACLVAAAALAVLEVLMP